MLEDLRANSWSLRPCCMVLAYRAAHFVRCGAKERPQQSVGGPAAGAVSHYHRMLFGYEIRAAATIGRRFTIHHGYAVVINKTW